MTEVWRSYTTLTDRHGQMAFVQTVRSVIDVAGQRVSAHDRLYLAAAVPTLIVWGDHDRIIPVEHAYRAAEAIPGARLEILEGAGHFLPWRDADRFLAILDDFLETTTPAHVPENVWRNLLTTAPPDDEEE
jgi:pimeloyl-ACP methyl ester carboxylesterase